MARIVRIDQETAGAHVVVEHGGEIHTFWRGGHRDGDPPPDQARVVEQAAADEAAETAVRQAEGSWTTLRSWIAANRDRDDVRAHLRALARLMLEG